MNPTIKLIAAFAVGFAIPAMAASDPILVRGAGRQDQEMRGRRKETDRRRLHDNRRQRPKTRVEAQEVMKTPEACATE